MAIGTVGAASARPAESAAACSPGTASGHYLLAVCVRVCLRVALFRLLVSGPTPGADARGCAACVGGWGLLGVGDGLRGRRSVLASAGGAGGGPEVWSLWAVGVMGGAGGGPSGQTPGPAHHLPSRCAFAVPLCLSVDVQRRSVHPALVVDVCSAPSWTCSALRRGLGLPVGLAGKPKTCWMTAT